MMTGRGRACVEVLSLLNYIADQENDDAGIYIYTTGGTSTKSKKVYSKS